MKVQIFFQNRQIGTMDTSRYEFDCERTRPFIWKQVVYEIEYFGVCGSDVAVHLK